MSTTIDINVTPTIQEVTINTVDNITVINVNTVSGGGIQSIVAGTNVTVDNTDPLNPIINSTGGGGSQTLQDVTDEGNETTQHIKVKFNDGTDEYISEITPNYIEVSKRDIASSDIIRNAFDVNSITRFNTLEGSYSIDLTEASDAVPTLVQRVLKAPILTADATVATTDNIPTELSELGDDASHRVVTDTQIATWNALIGGSVFQTVWNASTNTPTLTSSVGTKGFYYIVNVDGSTNLNGITDWKVGDWAIFDGSVWRKVDNTDAVSSVNGLTGAVLLDTSNVPDTNDKRYLTNAERTKLDNTSGSNTGDNATNSQYSGLATSKQDTLVSGTNIKTINSNSILGSGDIVISGSGITAEEAIGYSLIFG
jgi:hypothetical protein